MPLVIFCGIATNQAFYFVQYRSFHLCKRTGFPWFSQILTGFWGSKQHLPRHFRKIISVQQAQSCVITDQLTGFSPLTHIKMRYLSARSQFFYKIAKFLLKFYKTFYFSCRNTAVLTHTGQRISSDDDFLELVRIYAALCN